MTISRRPAWIIFTVILSMAILTSVAHPWMPKHRGAAGVEDVEKLKETIEEEFQSTHEEIQVVHVEVKQIKKMLAILKGADTSTQTHN